MVISDRSVTGARWLLAALTIAAATFEARVALTAQTFRPAVFTPAGTNQTVQPLPGVTVTFAEVTASGDTSAVAAAASRPVSGDFAASASPTAFLDIQSTATYRGGVTVCLSSAGFQATFKPFLRLLHDEDGAFRDVTVDVDLANDRVCGQSATLSQFTLARRVSLSGSPTLPRGVRAMVTGSTVVLGWSPPLDGGVPSSYTIEADAGSGTFPIQLSTPNADTRLQVAGVPAGTYQARVRAINALGRSASSVAISFTVGAGPLPSEPTGLQATVTGANVTLTWQAPAGGGPVQSYRLQAGPEPGRADIALDLSGGVTSFATAGVPAGLYYARVRAVNAAGVGAPSNDVRLAVGAVPCLAPAGPPTLSATVTGNTVQLAWTPPSGPITGFDLEAGSSVGLVNLARISFPASARSFTTSAPSGTYVLRLRARSPCDFADAGLASPEITIQVP